MESRSKIIQLIDLEPELKNVINLMSCTNDSNQKHFIGMVLYPKY